MPTKNNKHVKDTRGGLLGRARRALGGRQQQLDDAEARAMGKDPRKPKKSK